MEPRSAQTMVATAGFLKVTLSAISSSARRSRRHAAHQRFPLAAIHLACLWVWPLVALVQRIIGSYGLCTRNGRGQSHILSSLLACGLTFIFYLYLSAGIFVTVQVHQNGKPGHWASINVLNFYTPELRATARRATRTWGTGATQAAATTLLQ